MVLNYTIRSLLLATTTEAWLNAALNHLDLLLLDQANCEKKAAATAVSLLHRFDDDREFGLRLARIAREELKHFELVTHQLHLRQVADRYLSASRYAAQLHAWMSKQQPQRLIDQLLVCAMIEARSCERIGALLGVLDHELVKLYTKLHDAEDRHFEFYLAKAWQLDAAQCERRLGGLRALDAKLITDPDAEFRFHSGMPNVANG
ncbi:MAG: tRNA-(ms[2]io[6]A)-hydroxylase [Gammaproteobacteria bacterium]|nr:tRNA-(ms[2]io[6]A)-hydroxylase [Gammaproteobacteria bacterium]